MKTFNSYFLTFNFLSLRNQFFFLERERERERETHLVSYAREIQKINQLAKKPTFIFP